MNKILLTLLSAIIFFSLGLISQAEERDGSKSKLPIELDSNFPNQLIGTYCEVDSEAYQIIYDYGVLYMSDDFLSLDGISSTHLLNTISPAFTASFALADLIIDKIKYISKRN